MSEEAGVRGNRKQGQLQIIKVVPVGRGGGVSTKEIHVSEVD